MSQASSSSSADRVTHAAPPREPVQILAAVRALADELAPESSRRDLEREIPHEPFRRLRETGLVGARVPRSYGGPQLSYRELARAYIQLAAADSNVAQALIPHFTAVERLRLMGTPAQQDRYFAAILAGGIFAGGTSERGGQFRTDITTTLRRDGDGFRLTGTKFYSTGSLMADWLRVTAINEAGERITIFLPKDREGIELLDDWQGMGQRVTASGTSHFRDVVVHADEVIPFALWESQQRNYGSSATQLLHATIEVGIAQAALRDTLGWARRARPVRESGVTKSTDDPYVQHTIGKISAHNHAAEAIIERAASSVDRAAEAWFAGQIDHDGLQKLAVDAAIAVAEARIIAHEAALSAAELLYEVGGASATLREHNFDRHWRNARTHTTHDPVSYKFKVIGDYRLNDQAPPISLYY